MNGFNLGWTHDCCRSSFQDRRRGNHFRAMLQQAEFKPGSPGHFFQVSLRLPLSLKSYLALRRFSLAAFGSNYLTLISGRPKCHALIPNIWKAEAGESVAAFLRLPRNLNVATGDVLEKFPFRSLPFLELLKGLEAALPGHFSPLMICIAGLRFQSAQPSLIDLTATAVTALPSVRPHHIAVPQNFKILIRDLRAARLESDGQRAEAAFDQVEAKRDQMQIQDQILLAGLRKIYAKARSTRFTTAERLLRGMSTVVNHFYQADLPDSLPSPELAAYRLLADLELLPTEFKNRSFRRKHSSPRPYALVPPQLYHEAYGLNEPPPNEIKDVAASALRILACVLAHCGRRACCLLAITLGDFHVAHDPIKDRVWIDLNIRFTKSKNEVEMRLPLSALWPEQELAHLQIFLEKTADLFLNTTLLELLESRGISQDNPDCAAQVLRKRFNHATVLLGTSSLHLPRITWATYWPLRVWCAFRPEYLQHPCLTNIRQHVWFSQEMLTKVRDLVRDEATDSLELARRLTGHASTYEFIVDYCRSWPLLMELQAGLKTS